VIRKAWIWHIHGMRGNSLKVGLTDLTGLLEVGRERNSVDSLFDFLNRGGDVPHSDVTAPIHRCRSDRFRGDFFGCR
jgi:hypothetical protein